MKIRNTKPLQEITLTIVTAPKEIEQLEKDLEVFDRVFEGMRSDPAVCRLRDVFYNIIRASRGET